jgi:2-polyprenyl-6-methoxyphenol hydroxylase-like FAD-dependent oxidoreductase
MKVAIVGAGIAGLSLALCLQRHGHRALIVEKARQLRGGGYMIDFVGPGYDAAEKLGLLPELQKIHFPIAYLTWVDGRGKVRISRRYTDLRKLLNNRHFNFMRGDLEKLLYELVKDKSEAEVRFGTTLSSFKQDGEQVQASFSDGTADAFDLLVGADGVHSSMRSMLFGEESRFHRFLGYNTAAFVIDQEEGQEKGQEQGREEKINARRDAFQTLTEPHRQVAIYPSSGDRLVAFFIYEAPRELTAYTHEAAVAELQRVYGDMDWVVPGLLESSRQTSDIYFDAVTQIELPRWSNGRVTLVGDACQCVSLLAGQGASMAVAGAYTLADELSGEGVTAGTGVEAALARYEQRLKPEIMKRQASGRRIAHWFVPGNRVQLVLSNLITRSSTWPLVSTFVRRALNSGSKI